MKLPMKLHRYGPTMQALMERGPDTQTLGFEGSTIRFQNVMIR